VGDIAPTKAMTKAMTKVAKHSGLSTASLYEALPGKRRPSFATILKGVSALGLRAISSAEAERSAASASRAAKRLALVTLIHQVQYCSDGIKLEAVGL